MLEYLEDSEDLKVGLSELKEQLETPEEAGFSIMQIVKQARNEGGPKLFQIFRQEENEVYIASSARWNTQLKGFVELERHCQDLVQEVELQSKRQEVLAGMVVSKKDMQTRSTHKVSREGIRGIQGVRGAKAKDALELVQKKHMLIKWEGERERAMILQRLGRSRAVTYWNDAREIMSVESCSSSMACDMEEAG